MSKVYPSALALATCADPIMPLAPGLLSTMTGCPSFSPRRLPISRAVMSVPPPGA